MEEKKMYVEAANEEGFENAIDASVSDIGATKENSATENIALNEECKAESNTSGEEPAKEDEAPDTRTTPRHSSAEGSVSKNSGPKKDNRRGGTAHRLVSLAAFVALALILSFIESRIPTFVAIPGVKIGLANIVVVFCLYRMRPTDAAVVSLVRVALSSLLFGSLTSFLYGLGGATVSLALMIVLKRLNFGSIAVSTVGGVSHNIAQIAVASILLGTNVVGYYLPFLVLSGTIAGIVVGVAGGILEKKVPLA